MNVRDFTRTAAALVRANDDHADDFAAWEREISSGGTMTS